MKALLFLFLPQLCFSQLENTTDIGRCLAATHYTKLEGLKEREIYRVCSVCFTDEIFSFYTPEYGVITFRIAPETVTSAPDKSGMREDFINEEDYTISRGWYSVDIIYGNPKIVTISFTQAGMAIVIKANDWIGQPESSSNGKMGFSAIDKSKAFCDCGSWMPSRVFDSIFPVIKIDKGIIKNAGDTVRFINVLGNPYNTGMQSYQFDKNTDIQSGYSAKISSLLDSTIFKGKKLDTVLELIPILNYDQTLRYLELDEHYNDRIVTIDGEKYPEDSPDRRPCYAFLITKYSKYKGAIEQVQKILIKNHFKWAYPSARVSPDIDSSELKNYRIISLPIFIRFPSVIYSAASNKSDSKNRVNKK